MFVSYVFPTRNRPDRVQQTLDALSRLSARAHENLGGGEVVIVDNASDHLVAAPSSLQNGLPVRALRLRENLGAAARNLGVNAASGRWIVMLDDDSFPVDDGHLGVMTHAAPDIAAIGAEIMLPSGDRESGGLPEVFVGCGAAIRREAFTAAGGYDPAFGYYAEEYDLSARFILNGWRVVHHRGFRVLHQKVAAGRDMNLILHRLVRNNAWVAQRYAPESECAKAVEQAIGRYGWIAIKEHAAAGYAAGVRDLLESLSSQPRRPMTQAQYDRFTGLSHVRTSLAVEGIVRPGCRAAVVREGKNAWAVHQALRELGAIVVSDEQQAEVLVVGAMSPGPMMDASDQCSRHGRPAVMPWRLEGELAAVRRLSAVA